MCLNARSIVNNKNELNIIFNSGELSYSARAKTNQGRQYIRYSFVITTRIKVHGPLGNMEYDQIHFDINVKSESKNKKT